MSIPDIPRQRRVIKRPRVPHVVVYSGTGQVYDRIPFDCTNEDLQRYRAELNVQEEFENPAGPDQPLEDIGAAMDEQAFAEEFNDTLHFNSEQPDLFLDASIAHGRPDAVQDAYEPINSLSTDQSIVLPVVSNVDCIFGSGSRFQLHVLPPDSGRTMNICVAIFAVDYQDGTRMVASCSSCPTLQQELQSTYGISATLPASTAPKICRCPHIALAVANLTWCAGMHTKAWLEESLQDFLVACCIEAAPEPLQNVYTTTIPGKQNIFVVITSCLQMRLFKRTANRHFLCLTCGKAREKDCSHLAECRGLLMQALQTHPVDSDSDADPTAPMEIPNAPLDSQTRDFLKDYLYSKKTYICMSFKALLRCTN
jgi:hypothetical protein